MFSLAIGILFFQTNWWVKTNKQREREWERKRKRASENHRIATIIRIWGCDAEHVESSPKELLTEKGGMEHAVLCASLCECMCVKDRGKNDVWEGKKQRPVGIEEYIAPTELVRHKFNQLSSSHGTGHSTKMEKRTTNDARTFPTWFLSRKNDDWELGMQLVLQPI